MLAPPAVCIWVYQEGRYQDWPLVMFAIILFSYPFTESMRVRYRGWSLFLLTGAYTVGEISVCVAIPFYPLLIETFL